MAENRRANTFSFPAPAPARTPELSTVCPGSSLKGRAAAAAGAGSVGGKKPLPQAPKKPNNLLQRSRTQAYRPARARTVPTPSSRCARASAGVWEVRINVSIFHQFLLYATPHSDMCLSYLLLATSKKNLKKVRTHLNVTTYSNKQQMIILTQQNDWKQEKPSGICCKTAFKAANSGCLPFNCSPLSTCFLLTVQQALSLTLGLLGTDQFFFLSYWKFGKLMSLISSPKFNCMCL